MSSDVVILNAAVQSTPAGYTVPLAAEIGLLTARAIVDGSGAAVSFVPTLELVSPGGQIVWRSPVATPLAAGASADVSWFPGVTSGAGAGIQLGWGQLTGLSQTLPASAGATQLSLGIAPNPAVTFLTNDSQTFQSAASVTFPGTLGMQALQEGFYMATFTMQAIAAGYVSAGNEMCSLEVFRDDVDTGWDLLPPEAFFGPGMINPNPGANQTIWQTTWVGWWSPTEPFTSPSTIHSLAGATDVPAANAVVANCAYRLTYIGDLDR